MILPRLRKGIWKSLQSWNSQFFTQWLRFSAMKTSSEMWMTEGLIARLPIPPPYLVNFVADAFSFLRASYFSVVICNRISLSYSVQVLCSLFIIVLPLQFLYFCILSFESFLLGRISLPRSYFQEEVMRLYTLNF